MTNKVSSLNKIFPTDDRTLKRLRALYADWNWTLSEGYIRYSLGNSPSLYEHRLMVEVLYGRNAERYHVHHKDHISSHNDSCNLEVLDPSTHSKIHRLRERAGRVSTKVVRQCAACGATVERERRKAKLHKLSFCNRECFKKYSFANWLGAGKRPYAKPPERDELASLLKSHTREEIGVMYGCLKYTVSRWITRYGLARHGQQLTG